MSEPAVRASSAKPQRQAWLSAEIDRAEFAATLDFSPLFRQPHNLLKPRAEEVIVELRAEAIRHPPVAAKLRVHVTVIPHLGRCEWHILCAHVLGCCGIVAESTEPL